MKSIKPKEIFAMCENLGLHHEPTLNFLPPSQIGSIRSIEAAIIVSLLRIIDAERILEIGTYKGYTTSLLAMNSNANAVVYSIDLPLDENHRLELNLDDILKDGNVNDLFLINEQFRDREIYCRLLSSRFSDKIRLIKADSTKLDFRSIAEDGKAFDLIFIDGGHDYATAYHDSINAISIRGENTIILWHDYESSLHTDVSKVIEEISLSNPIFSIPGTSLAISLPNSLFELLKSTK